MSVSDMNVSWSTASAQLSSKTSRNSTFMTETNKDGQKIRRRQKCLSAKNTGMRFPGWKEPKPLRSRCGSASHENDQRAQSIPRSAHKNRESSEESDLRRSQIKDGKEVKEMINRLSQPTLSSKVKTSTARAREAGVDMNWYSWSKMNVYKDYQGVIYGNNGTLKRPVRSKER